MRVEGMPGGQYRRELCADCGARDECLCAQEDACMDHETKNEELDSTMDGGQDGSKEQLLGSPSSKTTSKAGITIPKSPGAGMGCDAMHVCDDVDAVMNGNGSKSVLGDEIPAATLHAAETCIPGARVNAKWKTLWPPTAGLEQNCSGPSAKDGGAGGAWTARRSSSLGDECKRLRFPSE